MTPIKHTNKLAGEKSPYLLRRVDPVLLHRTQEF